MNEDEQRKQAEEDVQEDLELEDKDAEDVAGGVSIPFSKVVVEYKGQDPGGN